MEALLTTLQDDSRVFRTSMKARLTTLQEDVINLKNRVSARHFGKAHL